MTNTLAEYEINIFEEEQLTRVKDKKLGATLAEAKYTRANILASYLQTKAPGERLRQRVNELLGASAVEAGVLPELDVSVHEVEDLEDFEPYDPTHPFWEQIKQLGFAFREIRRAEINDEEVEELLTASEPVMAIVARLQQRKAQTRVSKIKL